MSQKNTNIVIVGNSGFARECYVVLRALQKKGENINFCGFLSFEGYKADLLELSEYYLGIDDNYNFKEDQKIIIGIGDPELRAKCYDKLKKKKVFFYNLIHPDVYIDDSSNLGEANIITSGCYISCNCTIGNANILNGVVHVGHDVTIGNYNLICPAVQIGGNVKIGDRNLIGTMCSLLPKCKIGNSNKIAPLSAVYKGCRNGTYMLGNPALNIR